MATFHTGLLQEFAHPARIRDLRADFRSLKRRIEPHGEVIITDRGEPAYVIKFLPPAVQKRKALPITMYYARLLGRQPAAVSAEETLLFWEEERR